MPDDHTNELRDIAFRKIGRNVVNLQRFERMLKLIIVRSNVSGYASELAKIHQNKTKETNVKTLGSLVNEFFNTIYSTDDPFTDGPADVLNEIWISHGFRVESNEDSVRRRKTELRQVADERNLLIHHWLAELDLDSGESCQELNSRLDEQDDRLKPHYEWVMRLIGDIHEAQQELNKQLETHLRELRELREGESST